MAPRRHQHPKRGLGERMLPLPGSSHKSELVPFSLALSSPDFPNRGRLEISLELYRKARTYVPDNEKLHDRCVGHRTCRLSRSIDGRKPEKKDHRD